ncbi:uncharacterized protein lrrc41 isoform X2 [Cynoglossus semilaevis]|uniref:uncharacterized protein lrrc41 isoform X2 n=1 Tax=Cynoglossus semilaevis TaxID=244447 RepID=UPI00049570F8|nr:leucine-rich repeat-containing protein 41 isoform X2 [Cynoglossus semilaevis]
MAGTAQETELSLKEICFYAVRQHFAALGADAVLGLPPTLIKSLIPYLTISHLAELQPQLTQRGISSYTGWLQVIQGEYHRMDYLFTENAVMRLIFLPLIYCYENYLFPRIITKLKTQSFLWAAAQFIRTFVLISDRYLPLHRLTDEYRPLLELLEKQIRCISCLQCPDLSKRQAQVVLYIIHRLLDHGVATELIMHGPSPTLLTWLIYRRGSQYVCPKLKHHLTIENNNSASSPSQDEASCSRVLSSEDQCHQPPLCKRPRLHSMLEEEETEKANLSLPLQDLCQTFSAHKGASAGPCPRGEIHKLQISQCDPDCLRVLNCALPTFFCLRSLTIESSYTFRDCDVLDLSKALKQLSDSPLCRLTNLSISSLPDIRLAKLLLDAIPKVAALHVEVEHGIWRPYLINHLRTTEAYTSELVLEKLTLKVNVVQTDLQLITSLLRRSPRLSSLHLSGLRLQGGSSLQQLLTTLSESNTCLKCLSLEDMNLSDCLPGILHLLRCCQLEELHLNDCRLLEKCSDKEQSLQQLVSAVKTLSSLHTLSLAQNRLAKTVSVLAKLFSEPSPSSVRQLDLRSNFIRPAELLEFSQRLKEQRPPQRLTLDLRKNPEGGVPG